MRCVLIVQARTGSTRLPGKVLMDLAGRPMLGQQLRRLARCTTVDEIVVATTPNAADDAVVDVARDAGVAWHRGDEADVLRRFVDTAERFSADVVVRSTADCPLIDAPTSDAVIRALTESDGADYASNIEPRTFPRGLDTEALTIDALRRIDQLATEPEQREHVTILAYRDRPEEFSRRSFTQARDDSDLSWTVDTTEDLERVRRIYDALDLADRDVAFDEIVSVVRARPELR